MVLHWALHIIKDKLFIFGNLEYEKSPQQVIYWRASTDGISDHQTISRTTETDLQAVSDYLKINTGTKQVRIKISPQTRQTWKCLIRLDWNINETTKLKHSVIITQKNTAWNPPNGNSTDGSYQDQTKNRVERLFNVVCQFDVFDGKYCKFRIFGIK